MSATSAKGSECLGDAFLCAERHMDDEHFAVLLGDAIIKSQTLCTKHLMDVFNRYEKSTLSLKAVSNDRLCK